MVDSPRHDHRRPAPGHGVRDRRSSRADAALGTDGVDAIFVCPPSHDHDGTTVCGKHHGCHCDKCRARNAADSRTRRKLIAYGRYDSGLVDILPVREHVERLQSFGYGLQRISELAEVSLWAVIRSVNRDDTSVKRIRRQTADRLLALQPDVRTLAPSAHVPATATQRRLQALMCMGWSLSKIGTRLGRDKQVMSRTLHSDRVEAATHLAVASLYDDLWDQVPPSDTPTQRAVNASVRAYARKHNWVPPLGWDDIENDAEPMTADDDDSIDEIAVELAMQGNDVKLTVAERREALTRLHARKWADPLIAETLHVDSRTVLRDRQELGLEAYEYDELVKRGAA